MNLANEKFVYFRRTPTPGMRFVRVTRWAGEAPPHQFSLVDRECLGWTLDCTGRVVRLYYIITAAPHDGCRSWSPDPIYPDTPVDPASIKVRQPGAPPREQYSAEDVELTEDAHRRETRDHWAAFHANAAALAKARAEQQAKAEREAAERESVRVILTPRPQRPKSLWSRLFG